MSASSEIHKEAEQLCAEGEELSAKLAKDVKLAVFRDSYNAWYTKAVRVVMAIAPERLKEFQSYYEIDPKRKTSGYGHYSIQDYLKAVAPSYRPGFDPKQYTHTIFSNQISILRALLLLLDSRVSNISSELFFEIIDEELRTATELVTISPRAAGSLAGVVLEKHLSKVAANHGIQPQKRSPTISDFNDSLKKLEVYDTPTWRKIAYLADIRNACAHERGTEPKAEQVTELIEGVNWVIKNAI